MLQLKDITKSYQSQDFKQVALDKVSLSFRSTEFVAILGPSGSGKTTCLNIIGGLDRYDSGDLIINGKSTKKFADRDWDAYRNNSVGFVFQSYNLISHLNLLNNVEMGMTLSGVSVKVRRKKAIEVLEKVGLKDHIYKKPNQLSGGQMQRVAIARAIANDPDIIMMDEPTGALDTATSQQIMELIKEVAKDKLVIMVTHNPLLAEKYASRIVRFQDGKVISDSNQYEPKEADSIYKLKKTKMSFLTALKLSGTNIATKKWRTALTSFASSIGIIGIALVLSLSTGFQDQIAKFQNEAMTNMPIMITQTPMFMDEKSMKSMNDQTMSMFDKNKPYASTDYVTTYNPNANSIQHVNKITQDYLNYINKIDPKICSNIGYTRMVSMNLLRESNGKAYPVTIPIGINMGTDGNSLNQFSASSQTNSMMNAGLTSYPYTLGGSKTSYLETNYDLLAGSYPKSETDMVLIINNENCVVTSALKNIGYDVADSSKVKFTDIVGTKFKVVTNNDFYTKTQTGSFIPNSDYTVMYNDKDDITLKISGVVRLKKGTSIGVLANGIAYSDKLVDKILAANQDSDIVNAQKASDVNVMSMQPMDKTAKEQFLTYLGSDAMPSIIFLYPPTFKDKDALLSYLDKYNAGKSQDDAIIYTDMAATMSQMTSGIMDAITMVLVAFAAISLIVSLIMIGIITYISVLERTKEIGILRALGARKIDISNVFNAETFIIGMCSGIGGIVIAYLLTIPINHFIEVQTKLANCAQLNPLYAIMLVAISVVLTLIGGLIPARLAAKKDPVVALRTE